MVGEKAAEGIVKGLITEDQIMCEAKYSNAFPIKNYVNLIVASNNEWVISAAKDERRYLV